MSLPRCYGYALSAEALKAVDVGCCDELLAKCDDILELGHLLLSVSNHVLVRTHHRYTYQWSKGWKEEDSLFEPLETFPLVRALNIFEFSARFAQVGVEVWELLNRSLQASGLGSWHQTNHFDAAAALLKSMVRTVFEVLIVVIVSSP